MLDEQTLKVILNELNLTPNEEEIVKVLSEKELTPRKIKEKVDIQGPHIYSALRHLRQIGIIEELRTQRKGEGKIQRLSIGGLAQLLSKQVEQTECRLEDIKQVQKTFQILLAEGSTRELFKAVTPEFLEDVPSVHRKIAEMFEKCKKLVITTRSPFLWNGRYHGSGVYEPIPGTEEFWKAQMIFLRKSINDRTFRLSYIVDVDKYISAVEQRSESEKVNDVRAIFECIKGINGGWNLDFVETREAGLKFAPLALTTSLDDGYCLLVTLYTNDVVTNAIFFKLKNLSDLVATYHATHFDKKPKLELIKIAHKVINKVGISTPNTEKLKEELQKMTQNV